MDLIIDYEKEQKLSVHKLGGNDRNHSPDGCCRSIICEGILLMQINELKLIFHNKLAMVDIYA